MQSSVTYLRKFILIADHWDMADCHSNPPVSKAGAMQAMSHSLWASKALSLDIVAFGWLISPCLQMIEYKCCFWQDLNGLIAPLSN